MTTTTQRGAVRGRQRNDLPPLIPALAYGALMVSSVVLSAGVPRLTASAADVLTYNQAHTTASTVAGFLGFGASIPLAIWTATAYRRLRTLGVTVAGPVIALVGGVLASTAAALTGLLTWTGAQLGATGDAGVARVVADLGFATGSAGFVVPFALLIAGVAVPSLILGFGPRALAVTGLVIAAIGMLGAFTLIAPALDPALPIVRFGGLLWIIAASVLLPRDRHAAGARR